MCSMSRSTFVPAWPSPWYIYSSVSIYNTFNVLVLLATMHLPLLNIYTLSRKQICLQLRPSNKGHLFAIAKNNPLFGLGSVVCFELKGVLSRIGLYIYITMFAVKIHIKSVFAKIELKIRV